MNLAPFITYIWPFLYGCLIGAGLCLVGATYMKYRVDRL